MTDLYEQLAGSGNWVPISTPADSQRVTSTPSSMRGQYPVIGMICESIHCVDVYETPNAGLGTWSRGRNLSPTSWEGWTRIENSSTALWMRREKAPMSYIRSWSGSPRKKECLERVACIFD